MYHVCYEKWTLSLSKTLSNWSRTHGVIVHIFQSVCLNPGSVVKGAKSSADNGQIYLTRTAVIETFNHIHCRRYYTSYIQLRIQQQFICRRGWFFDWTGSSEARSRPGRVCCKVMRGQQCHNTHKVNKTDTTHIRIKYSFYTFITIIWLHTGVYLYASW